MSVSNRTSRSPLQLPPSTAASSYPLHYAGPGAGPVGSLPHSYSPSPAGSNSGSNSGGGSSGSRSGGPHYMPPPPSVSPSRSPAALGAPAHPSSSYPAMRYSPAPQQTAPVPSTSPSAKKTSPSPQQQQQHQALSASSYGRPISGSGGSTVGRPDQTVPLSLITPTKLSAGVYPTSGNESAPPPAHTARTNDPRDLRDIRERDIRIYPHTAFSPLAHPLPPPQALPTSSRAMPPAPQQQPLDLGTYREDSPIPLISSSRLPTGEAHGKKTRPEQQPPPPPQSIPVLPAYPSLGPVGYPGSAPLMSVAALIDAGFSTSATQVKPPSSSGLPQYALGLPPTARLPSDTPPLMPTPSSAASVPPMPVIIKTEPPSSMARSSPAPLPELPPTGATTTAGQLLNSSSTRSPPAAPEVKVKLEPGLPSQPMVGTGNNNGGSVPNNLAGKNNGGGSNNSAKPVHKLKTAWLQRHTGKLPGARLIIIEMKL